MASVDSSMARLSWKVQPTRSTLAESLLAPVSSLTAMLRAVRSALPVESLAGHIMDSEPEGVRQLGGMDRPGIKSRPPVLPLD